MNTALFALEFMFARGRGTDVHQQLYSCTLFPVLCLLQLKQWANESYRPFCCNVQCDVFARHIISSSSAARRGLFQPHSLGPRRIPSPVRVGRTGNPYLGWQTTGSSSGKAQTRAEVFRPAPLCADTGCVTVSVLGTVRACRAAGHRELVMPADVQRGVRLCYPQAVSDVSSPAFEG